MKEYCFERCSNTVLLALLFLRGDFLASLTRAVVARVLHTWWKLEGHTANTRVPDRTRSGLNFVASRRKEPRNGCQVRWLGAWTRQPRRSVEAILYLFENTSDMFSEKKHFEELGCDVDARLEHAEFEARVCACRATLQAARETLETVGGLAAFLRAYVVEFDTRMVSVWTAIKKYDHNIIRSCRRIPPSTSPLRIGVWMLRLLAQIA